MSRSLTLEEYLQEFVDESTQSAGTEEVRLFVTDRQAQTLGFFLINGLSGFIERMRLDRTNEHDGQILAAHDEWEQHDDDAEEFIN